MSAAFQREARATYAAANAASLRWMLARRRLAPWLDTKLDPLTLRDYGEGDGWRGPAFTYGWIQGRGLEALARHAGFFRDGDPALADALFATAAPLEAALARLVARDGGAFFTWHGDGLRPARPGAAAAIEPQTREPDIATFSDIFVWKGLLAARQALGGDMDGAAAALARIGRLIGEDRFLIDEKAPITAASLARQGREYGPRMIFLGACALAAGGDGGAMARAAPFVRHVLTHHLTPAGLLSDEPGGDRVNPGHAIEFAGFALECRRAGWRDAPVDMLADLLVAHWRIGRHGPGLALHVSAATGAPLTPWRPWWSLPETIRAAALAFEATGRADLLDIWREAHDVFFGRYWRGDPPIAYQTLTDEGPVDHVPATPDLDPGYHTGLSLLGAIEVVDRMA